jgi:hypothetical protein
LQILHVRVKRREGDAALHERREQFGHEVSVAVTREDDGAGFDSGVLHLRRAPNLNGDDPNRVAGLVKETSKFIWHRQWPMKAEDLLGLVQRETLLQAPTTKELTAMGDKRFVSPW